MGELKVGALDIEEAELNLDIYKRSSGKSSSFSISGKVTIQEVRLDCHVSYEKIEKKWNLVVYAGIEAKAFGLGTIFPEFKNTFADSLKFSKLAFIYSSEDAKTQDENFKFEVKQGLQLMGVLEEIPALSALTGVIIRVLFFRRIWAVRSIFRFKFPLCSLISATLFRAIRL